ncbi:Epoxide hydrolase [Mycena indigotica]|uniref:Epoxide hydrolase n=1 Tax=Mycena indigotica TaxID=2126181 RepID=A0A8H6SCH2_9AGAR|nr:Epoxide hydrolase [Mycena indigotica]KAF7295330.1 Epoxide hydrolase [Mycena indigotica]
MNDYRAVIFDIGGVVMRSPFIAIAATERRLGLPENYLNTSIVERGPNGAWQRFERGEIQLQAFYQQFSRDLSDTANGNQWYAAYCKRKGLSCPPLPEKLSVDGREVLYHLVVYPRANFVLQLFGSMMREAVTFDPHMLRAIRRIRAAGKHKIIALTNNFARSSTEDPIPPSELEFLGWNEGGATPAVLRGLFDDFCDSSELGARKPEPRFYRMALERNGLLAHQVVFLDDIGINLKAAKQLGMETIHVPLGGNLNAARQLEAKLGIDLTRNPTEEEVRMAKL